jgi:hypothetical protein
MKTLEIILMTGYQISYLCFIPFFLALLVMIVGNPISVNNKRKLRKKMEEYEKKWNAAFLFRFSEDRVLLKSKTSSNEGWISLFHIDESGNLLPPSAIDFSEIMMDQGDLCRVKKDCDLGYFNIQTGHIIKPQYKVASPFQDGRAQVQTFEQDVFLINEKGICIN